MGGFRVLPILQTSSECIIRTVTSQQGSSDWLISMVSFCWRTVSFFLQAEKVQNETQTQGDEKNELLSSSIYPCISHFVQVLHWFSLNFKQSIFLQVRRNQP